MRRLAIVATGGLLSSCAATGVVPPAAAPVVLPPLAGRTGLERVMGRDANALIQLFGQPEADVREGTARKLQFANSACVLDAYLYPKGSSAPQVSYLDARLPDGSPVDRAACVQALSRRK
ncbi:MAG: hypothetical protein K2P79_13950 [Sphingomonas sp.]|nr:hypothetical protein [Sphingomonas sp.]